MIKVADEAVQAVMDAWSADFPIPTRDEIVEMLGAALPYLPLGFEVKKLEWVCIPACNGILQAKTSLGIYSIGSSKVVRLGLKTLSHPFQLLDDAKAFAQADFESRVRECMVAKPVDVAAVRRQAFEEAAKLVETSAYRSTTEGRSIVPCQFAKHDQHHATIAAAIRALSIEPAQSGQRSSA